MNHSRHQQKGIKRIPTIHSDSDPEAAASARQQIDSNIEQAIESGEWSHLPGKGRPFDLRALAMSPEERAQKLLKDAGFVPDWVELQKKIESLEDDLKLAAVSHGSSSEALTTMVTERCQSLNELIRQYNGKVPSPWLQKGLRSPDQFLR